MDPSIKYYLEKITASMEELRIDLRANTDAVKLNNAKLDALVAWRPDLGKQVSETGAAVAALQQGRVCTSATLGQEGLGAPIAAEENQVVGTATLAVDITIGIKLTPPRPPVVASTPEVATEPAICPHVSSTTGWAKEIIYDGSPDCIAMVPMTCSMKCANQDNATLSFPPPITTVSLLSAAATALVTGLVHPATNGDCIPQAPLAMMDVLLTAECSCYCLPDTLKLSRMAMVFPQAWQKRLMLRPTPWPSFWMDLADGNEVRPLPWPSFACSRQGITLNHVGLPPQVTYVKKNLFGDLNCVRASWSWRYLPSVHLKPYSSEKVVCWIHTVARANSVIMRLLDGQLKLCSELPNGYLIYMDFINIALMGSEVIHRKQINHKGLLSYSCYGLQPWGGPEYFIHGDDAYELYLKMLALVRKMWKSEHCWASRLCLLQWHNKLLDIMCTAPSYSLQVSTKYWFAHQQKGRYSLLAVVELTLRPMHLRMVLAVEVFRGLIRTATAENNGLSSSVLRKISSTCTLPNVVYLDPAGLVLHRAATAHTGHGVHLVIQCEGLLLPPLRKGTEPQPWPPPTQVQIVKDTSVLIHGIAQGCVADDSSHIWWPPDHQPRMRSKWQQFLHDTQWHAFQVFSINKQSWPFEQLTFLVSYEPKGCCDETSTDSGTTRMKFNIQSIFHSPTMVDNSQQRWYSFRGHFVGILSGACGL